MYMSNVLQQLADSLGSIRLDFVFEMTLDTPTLDTCRVDILMFRSYKCKTNIDRHYIACRSHEILSLKCIYRRIV